jgi:hypothetical protein
MLLSRSALLYLIMLLQSVQRQGSFLVWLA